MRTQRFYTGVDDSLTRAGTASYASFLNFGYVANSKPRRSKLEPARHAFNKNSIRLLYELLGDTPVQGRDVLEVGCGRGGNLATVAEEFYPRVAIGLDLCIASIAHCARVHEFGWFCAGDAENLPFRDRAFDLVLNIESSHSYPCVKKFLEHTSRVLRLDGYFLYSDLFASGEVSARKDYMQDLGFSLIREDDISENVLLSCDEIALQRLQAYARVENASANEVNAFLATPGSLTYENLKSGASRYISMIFRKSSC